MHSSKFRISLVSIAACAALLPLLAMAPIKREATDSRAALTKLETKPLAPDALASLTDWTHPGTLDPANTQGKVVVLAVVSTADPQSIMALSKLTRMHRDFKEQGILVAAIHPDAGFDLMHEKVAAGKVTIPVARDAGGAFAASMHTDNYPDYYVIDRAGNLRFADLDKRALKDAIELLVSETPESANTNAGLQAQGIEPAGPEATEEVKDANKQKKYSGAVWPMHNEGNLYAKKDSQGKRLPIPLLENEEWVSEERSLEDKVLVLDFWVSSSSSGNKAAKIYTKLLETHAGKVEIVGISGSEDKEKILRKLQSKKRDFAQLYDSDQTLFEALGISSTPHVIILSTDGIIRWQGFPLDKKFNESIEQIIEADPIANDG